MEFGTGGLGCQVEDLGWGGGLSGDDFRVQKGLGFRV